MPTFPSFEQLKDRLHQTLLEDLGETGDVTTKAIFSSSHHSTAHLFAKSDGVICGLPIISNLFEIYDSSIQIEMLVDEGCTVSPGDHLATIKGSTHSLLSAERTILNFLQHLSGVASLTRKFVQASGGKLKICDTRKTTPLWRDLEKYAVAIGGGTNHRMGLHDMIMLKDTHADGAGGLEEALRRVAPFRTQYQVACETRNIEEVQCAINAAVDLIMLDNMNKSLMQEAIALIAGKIEVEMTGNVTLETIGSISDLGADRVSIGALTHSAPILDISMKLEMDKAPEPVRGVVHPLPSES